MYRGVARHIPPGGGPDERLIGRLIRPLASEVETNPRARSARLRVAERLEAIA